MNAQTLHPIRISKTIIEELEVRCPDPDCGYEGMEKAGIYEIDADRCRKLLADCEYQGNIGADYIDPVNSGVTRAYRALHRQLLKALHG
jgi:phage-related protein